MLTNRGRRGDGWQPHLPPPPYLQHGGKLPIVRRELD